MSEPSQEIHYNTIGGDSRVDGITIQARDISGGIHLHEAPRPIPHQLPPVPSHFTNRRADLAALDRLLAEHAGADAGLPLIVVNGPAGIGKTTLVSRWVARHADDFPDGLLYADLRGHTEEGPAAPGEVLSRFLRSLGAASVPAALADQQALWRSQSARLKVAVILDNAFTAAQVRTLLPAGACGAVVVTSRRRLTGLVLDGAHFHHLARLDAADGVALIARGIGADRVADELPDVERLVNLCAGLPLAVCLASARLASRPRQPVSALANALAPDAEGLAALDIEGELTVNRALDASYAVLSSDSALVYRQLGQLPLAAFDISAVAAVCAEPFRWAEHRLDELVEANLVEDIGPDSYRFHDLVRIHAQELGAMDGPDASGEALRRVCDWYLRVTTAAEQRLTPAQFVLPRDYAHTFTTAVPFNDDTGALAWLDDHRLDLMTLTRTAASRGWHRVAWQLVDAMWPLFLRLRHYDLWIEAHRTGLAAARADAHPEATRQMLNSGAIGLNSAGRPDEAAAWYEESLTAARAAGDVRDAGQALLGLGRCRREAGRPDEAVPYLERAISIWEDCSYPRGVALARTVLGEIALDAGRTDAAVAAFTRARRELLAVDDAHDAARALAFLGRTQARAGDHRGGTARMEEALAVFTSSGAAHWQARTLEMLGHSARERGDQPAARDMWTRALTRYEVTSPDDARRLRDLLDQSPGGAGTG